ncbi:sulfatase family protein [Spirillospora sp. CA-142024]|uniref:sulfatase family protein n=1 Tax=Spirillospora sp. CA-142024 TaxID=3240036 RepID=UPI003D8BD0DC
MRRPVRLIAPAAAALSALASLPLAACQEVESQVRAPERPNIIFVLTDDLASNLVQYMPHVKQMQQRGMTFSDYYVTDSLCCPSRSTIFTGKYPHNTGVFTNQGADGGYRTFRGRGNEQATFATALRKSGYRTAMMGKYLNGYQPSDPVPPGWDEWDVAGNGYPEFNYTLNENGRQVRYGNRPEDYLTDVLASKGAGFVTRAAKDRRPFMMEIATFAPHGLATPAPRDAGLFPGLRAPRGPAFNEADISDKPGWLKEHPRLRPEQIRKIDTVYRKRARSVQAVDDLIGRLQATLKATGTDRDTYLIFSSDNGFHLGEHRLAQGKQTAFDTDIRVPLMVTGPGVPAGSTHRGLTQNTDLCPTFEELGGVPVPASVDGRSLVPALKGDPTPKREAVLIEHHGPNNRPDDPDRQGRAAGNPPSYEALRTAGELYVEYADGQREYYALKNDPAELDNTAGQLSPQRLERLHNMLNDLRGCRGGDCRT